MTAKTIYSGTTHSVSGAAGYARSSDGFLDIKMPEPHPAAENLFAAAWSACYMGAIGLVAQQRQVTLAGPPEVDATIDLLMDGTEFFLRARFGVALPGVDRETAQELIEAAHKVCPYSKAVHGNIEFTTELVELAVA